MATLAAGSIMLIGESAGAVWKVLNEKGPMSTAKLIKEVNAPRDLVMQALGWLAREDKIHIDDSRSRVVTLR